MSQLQTLRSVTSTNADVFHLPDLGRILLGKLADIIAVDGNPVKDISVLQHVSLVIKDGVVVKRN